MSVERRTEPRPRGSRRRSCRNPCGSARPKRADRRARASRSYSARRPPRRSTLTVPVSFESAPCFTALVASSWTISASVPADRSPIGASSPSIAIVSSRTPLYGAVNIRRRPFDGFQPSGRVRGGGVRRNIAVGRSQRVDPRLEDARERAHFGLASCRKRHQPREDRENVADPMRQLEGYEIARDRRFAETFAVGRVADLLRH